MNELTITTTTNTNTTPSPHPPSQPIHSIITNICCSINTGIKNCNTSRTINTNKQIWQEFGFIPNTDLTLHQNVKRVKLLRLKDNIPQPSHKAFHNLCKGNIQPPTGAVDVLGLGLNYCIESPYPHQGQNYTNSLKRLHRSIRIFDHYDKFNNITTPDDDNEYKPSLYIKNDGCIPDEKSTTIAHKFTLFSKSILSKYYKLSNTKRYNLTSHNRYCIKELVLRTDLIKGFTDKNLGPFIMPRPDYIQ